MQRLQELPVRLHHGANKLTSTRLSAGDLEKEKTADTLPQEDEEDEFATVDQSTIPKVKKVLKVFEASTAILQKLEANDERESLIRNFHSSVTPFKLMLAKKRKKGDLLPVLITSHPSSLSTSSAGNPDHQPRSYCTESSSAKNVVTELDTMAV